MIRDKDQIKQEIKNKSKEIMIKKLHYLQYYNPAVNSYPKSEYKFEEKCPFSAENIYLTPFFNYLRNSQEYVYQLLVNANSLEQYGSLSMFFCNFFYSNIFSEKSVDNELLFMIYRTLDKEISMIKKETQGLFLKNSINTYLLSTLVQQNDVQEYFRMVLKDVVEEIDEKYSEDLSLDIGNLVEKKKAKDDSKFKSFQNANKLTGSIIGQIDGKVTPSKTIIDKSIINDNYWSTLDKEELISEKDNKDDRMKAYLDKQIEIVSNSKFTELFSVSYYLDNKINKYGESYTVVEVYQKKFKVLIYFLDKILKSFEDNLDIIPESIKYICKIISILVKKKFQNENKQIPQFLVNSYIGKFFFSILLKTIMENPLYFQLFNTYYLTKNTQKNINMLYYLLNVMVSGNFFTFLDNDGAFSIFNRYFIKTMPKVFHIFDALVDVDLPPILKKFDDPNFNPADFSYDFIKEEQNEVIKDLSYVYSPEQLVSMLKIIKANLKKFNEISHSKNDGMAKTLDTLLDDHHYQKYENAMKEDRANKTVSFYYYLINQMTDEGNAIWAYTEPPFSLPENEKEKKENLYLIKVKNSLCKILYNFKKFPKHNLFGIEVKTTEDFMNAIKRLSMLKSLTMDCRKDSGWYYFTLKTFLGKIDKSYAENDYFKLYDEIQSDVTASLNNINFLHMSELEGAMRYLTSKIAQIETNIEIIENVQNTKSAQMFINKGKVEVYIREELNEEEGDTDIKIITPGLLSEYKKSVKEKKRKKDPLYETVMKKKENPIYSIEDFIRSFPNVAIIFRGEASDALEQFKKKQITNELDHYFAAINQTLNEQYLKEAKKEKTVDPSTIDKNHKKIVNYILNRLYDKLYPIESDKNDGPVFSKCVELAWVEPFHFIESAHKFNLDDILPNCIRLIKQIQNEKSPYIKKDLFETVYAQLEQSIKIYLDKNTLEFENLVPFLIYVVLKAQPQKLSSDLRFIEMFFSGEQRIIAFFKSVAQYIINDINRETFKPYHIEPEEYDIYCLRARNGEIV